MCIILKSHVHQALYYTLCIFIRNCIIPKCQVHNSSQHYSTLSTLLYILLYCATLHSLVLHCTLRDAKLCRTRLDCIHQLTTQHCTILHCTLYGTELYCTTLLCTRLLHYTALYYTIHYTLLNYSVQGFIVHYTPQWGAADAEIKVPSGENTELKRSPFIAWSRSVYSHTCYAYCQGFLPCLFLPFQSIHLHFFQNLSRFFLVLALANTGSGVGPQNKIGQPALCGFPC